MATSNAGGSDVASGTEQQAQTAALDTVASTVTTAAPLAGDPKVNVGISTSVTLPVEIVVSQTATATPASDAERIVVGLAGITSQPVGETGLALDVAASQVGAWSVTADQGRANPDERWSVTDTTTQAAVEAVEVELQDKALDTSVDGLEGLIGRRGTPADSTNVNASAGAESGLIFSGANTLRSIDAINLGAVGLKYTLMVFNAIALPANGATPTIRLPLPGGGSAHWDRGKNFSTGAYWAISTTDATLTVSGVANAVVDAEYGGT
jgi:hypothetical protein